MIRARTTAALLGGWLALAAGCHSPPRRGVSAGPITAYELAEGVRVTAGVQLLQFQSGRPDVVRARACVVSRNAAMQLEAALDWCALTVRIYERGATTGRVVLPAAPGDTLIACSHVLRGVTLLPGDTANFDASFQASHILGVALPEGSYRFTVVLNLHKPPLSTPELAAGTLMLRR